MNEHLNADQAELDQFNQSADQWWDPEGEMGPLHSINPARLAYIEKQCGGLQRLSAVDVGCGGGILSEALAAAGASVTGIDLAEQALEVAREHAAESGLQVDYHLQSAEQLAAEQPASFDLVCCMEMLEHVPDPAAIVQACATLVKPGGVVVLSTINRTAKAFALAIIGAEYVLGLIPRGTHDYAKLIKPSELSAWARQAGLATHDISGIRYNPMTGGARVVPHDVDINYLLTARPA